MPRLLTDMTVAASLERAGFRRVRHKGDNVAEILPTRGRVGVSVHADTKEGVFRAVLLNEWDEIYDMYVSSDYSDDSIESPNWAEVVGWIKIRSKK